MALIRGFFHIPGWLYDAFLGTMLRKVRRRVARHVVDDGLFPCLDICCGTGSQGRAITSGERYEAKCTPAGFLPEDDIGVNDHGSKKRKPPGKSHIPESSLVAGLDKDCRTLRFAARRAPSLPFVCGDAAALPFKNSKFKAVVLSFALHHLPPEERERLIGEARRVLSPGGKIVFIEFEPVWDRASRFGALFRDIIERMAGRGHYRNGREFLSRGGLRAFIRESGLEERDRHDVWAGAFGVVIATERSENHPIV